MSDDTIRFNSATPSPWIHPAAAAPAAVRHAYPLAISATWARTPPPAASPAGPKPA